jgi:asparagine synthase (glutamine-hydrolysing)
VSGIVGIYYLDGRPIDRTDLRHMVDTLAYRGPDGSAIWSEGSVGFGHRMLWTTPESLHEKLPFTDTSGNFTITADARIDNRDELLSALSVTSRWSSQVSDSEIILAAYEKWGERCVERLLGDFAFAIWDQRRRILFCARDHFGVKPYYYYSSGQIFAFASEIKSLLSLSEVPRRLNEVRVADYLIQVSEGIDKTSTFYQGVLRLPPGHTIRVQGGNIWLQQYWSLTLSEKDRGRAPEDYAEEFLSIFTESVRCRLRSAFPIGSMLSGGLDSSSIICVAQQLLMHSEGKQLLTFSAISEDPAECCESPFIDAVLRKVSGGVTPHFVRSDQVEPFAPHFEQVVWNGDDPFDASIMSIPRIMYAAARQHGVHVLLDGVDGDLVASHGPDYLAYLLRGLRLRSLVREVTAFARHVNLPTWKLFLGYGLKPLVPETLLRSRRILLGRDHPIWGSGTLINPEFARRVRLAERIQDLQSKEWDLAGTLAEDHLRALNSGIVPAALERYDRTAAALSVEPRHPFLDKRLIEFCLNLPSEQKMQEGWTKPILRRAMVGLLPEEVRWRGNICNLNPMFFCSLLAFERKLLDNILLDDLRDISEYVDVGALRDSYRRHLCEHSDTDAFKVWEVLTLTIWLRRNFSPNDNRIFSAVQPINY